MPAAQSALETISPDRIRKNPANPRMIFREEDMQTLLDSIQEVGIKVPLSVYRDGNHYVIIDGERRWRCARKLNLKDVPALVQPKPGKLENLLMMFNIHKVRVDWDIMPTALKLDEVRELLSTGGKPATVEALAGITGLSRSMVRTCFDLLALPKKYREMLLKEAEKPRSEQRITPDLFIEINKSRRVLEKYAPDVFDVVSPTQYVDRMVTKYKKGVVKNVVRFRDVSKMARGARAGVKPREVVPILKDLIGHPEATIERAYEATVKTAYEYRDVASRASGLLERLSVHAVRATMPPDVVATLRRLRDRLNDILRT